jgi:hypothetical protein
LAEIRAFKETYIMQSIRPAQDDWMLYKCLMNAISKEGKDKITIWKNQYLVNGYCSGNLLLKIIVRESYLDTNATTANIRKKLSSLDTYILTIGSDITKFKIHVSLLIDSLAARGESTQDLLTNLFKGYQAATEKTFVKYIGRKLKRNKTESYRTKRSLSTRKYPQTPPKAPLEKPSWFFKEPKEDELYKAKTWKDKSWYFCSPKTGGKCDGQYR